MYSHSGKNFLDVLGRKISISRVTYASFTFLITLAWQCKLLLHYQNAGKTCWTSLKYFITSLCHLRCKVHCTLLSLCHTRSWCRKHQLVELPPIRNFFGTLWNISETKICAKPVEQAAVNEIIKTEWYHVLQMHNKKDAHALFHFLFPS